MKEMQSTTYSFLIEENSVDEKTYAYNLASIKHSWLITNMRNMFPDAVVQEYNDNLSLHRYYYDSDNKLIAVISMHYPDEKFKMYMIIETIYQNGLTSYRNSITERK